MIIRSQGAVLRSVCLRLELWPILCQCRSKSTKSAIHAALKNSQPQYEVTGSRPSKAPRGRAPARDATRIKQRGLPEERFVGRAAQANQDFQKLLRSSHSGSHQPRSDRLRESSFSNDSDHLSHRNGRQSISPAENSHRLRGSMHHRRDDDETFELDRTTSPSPRSSRAHAASSLHNFLPKEEAFDVAEHSIPEPRAERLEPGRRTKKDFVGNNRYDIDGKISQLEFEDTEPTRLPYTTPASEFLYGHSVVMAALRSRRRKLYKMYIYQGPKREDEKRDMDMRKMALDLDVPVERVPATGLRMLDQVSEGRPHNGFVLEASPLPRLPIRGFDRVTWPGEHFLAFLDHQSREDEEINGTDPRIKCESVFPRFPFVLLLDGVLDPQNLGAILRSAFFLGVDAIILATHRTAPLSTVALKASAGASEGMPILTVSQVRPFLDECKGNGWKIYASTADPMSSGNSSSAAYKHLTTTTLVSDVSSRPCILILGSEGLGLYRDVQGAADNTISIEGPRRGEMGIDSLNVSVAAGLLCEALLRKPATMNAKPRYSSFEAPHVDEDRLF